MLISLIEEVFFLFYLGSITVWYFRDPVLIELCNPFLVYHNNSKTIGKDAKRVSHKLE